MAHNGYEELDYIKIERRDMKVAAVRRHITWNPMSWLSVIVRFFTGCRYNHAIIIHQINYVECVIEAVETGVRITPLEDWVKKYPHTLLFLKLPYKPDRGKLISSLGKSYDFTSLIKHQVKHQILRWFNIKKWEGRTGEKAAKKLYCSELVAYVYGIPEWWRFTTADLIEQCTE